MVSNASDDDDESVADLGSEPQQAPAPAAAQAAAAAARATQQPPKVLSHAVRQMRAKKAAKATDGAELQSIVDWVESGQQGKAERPTPAGTERTAAEVEEGETMARLVAELGNETAAVFEGVLPGSCARRSKGWRSCLSSPRRWCSTRGGGRRSCYPRCKRSCWQA